jgi:predicted MFS family arabinose efflux permease
MPAHRRAQALSLFRTAGDVGLFLGAPITGFIIDISSFSTAIHLNAGIMVTAVGFFAFQNYFQRKTPSPDIPSSPSK